MPKEATPSLVAIMEQIRWSVKAALHPHQNQVGAWWLEDQGVSKITWWSSSPLSCTRLHMASPVDLALHAEEQENVFAIDW